MASFAGAGGAPAPLRVTSKLPEGRIQADTSYQTSHQTRRLSSDDDEAGLPPTAPQLAPCPTSALFDVGSQDDSAVSWTNLTQMSLDALSSVQRRRQKAVLHQRDFAQQLEKTLSLSSDQRKHQSILRLQTVVRVVMALRSSQASAAAREVAAGDSAAATSASSVSSAAAASSRLDLLKGVAQMKAKVAKTDRAMKAENLAAWVFKAPGGLGRFTKRELTEIFNRFGVMSAMEMQCRLYEECPVRS